MADIILGIDVDSKDVVTADTAVDRLTDAVRGLEVASKNLAAASGRADAGIRGVSNASAQAQTRTQAAIGAYRSLHAVWISLATVAGGALVSGLLRTADAYTEITNKLRVVSTDQAEVNGLFLKMLDIANRTRQPVAEVATLYQRVSSAAKDLGASQAEVLQFVENTGKALALQGSSGSAAAGALLQLSQAIGGTTIQAEEFNSLIDGAYPLLQAVARGIDEAGGSVSRLKTLVKDGQLTNREFFDALLSQSDAIGESFGTAQVTVLQAMTVLRNNILAAVGDTDKATGATNELAQAILRLSNNIGPLIDLLATVITKVVEFTSGIGRLHTASQDFIRSSTLLQRALSFFGLALAESMGNVDAWAARVGAETAAAAAALAANISGMVANLKVLDAHLAHARAYGRPVEPKQVVEADVGHNQLRLAVNEAINLGEAEKIAAYWAAQAAAEAEKLAESLGGGGGGGGGGVTPPSGGGGGAAGAAGAVADNLERAREVLRGQQQEHQRLLDLWRGVGGETTSVVDDVDKLSEALADSGLSLDQFLETVGLTREGYVAILRESAKLTTQIDHQAKAAQDLVEAMRGLAFGTLGAAEGTGAIISALTDSAFGDTLDTAFKDAANTLADTFGKAMSRLGGAGGLSDFAVSSIGTGIGIAATGVLNGEAGQIGSGIGVAIGGSIGKTLGTSIGGTLGSIAGPLGAVLGGIAGSFIGNLFGKGSDDKWQPVSGTAFAGTTFASSVTTSTMNTQTDQGFAPEGRIAWEGTRALLGAFNSELAEFIDSLGGTMDKSIKLVVDQDAALEAITGTLSSRGTPYKGAAGKQAAADITERVSEIIGLAAAIAQKAGPQLTNAQQLWRETQKRFSDVNIAILRDLGFTAKQIYAEQADIRSGLAEGFTKEALDTLVDLGAATRHQLGQWKALELQALEDRRDAALATAKEIGASTALVNASFNAQSADIVAKWREMLDDMAEEVVKVTRGERLAFKGTALNELVQGGGTKSLNYWLSINRQILAQQRDDQLKEARRLGVEQILVWRVYNQKLVDLEKQYGELRNRAAVEAAQRAVDAMTRTIETLNTRLNNLERARADVLQELTKRADEARQAEEALAAARRGINGGELNPGGPMDRLRALQGQFGSAITAARGGNADAASRAAGLASELLQAGRGVFASGSGYTDLFRMVNAQLMTAQRAFDARADTIEAGLDAKTFVETSERSTRALLAMLSNINVGIARTEAQIRAQTRRLELAEQRRRVGT